MSLFDSPSLYDILDHVVVEVKDDQVILRKLSMDDILLEGEKDWKEGKTVLLRPRKE